MLLDLGWKMYVLFLSYVSLLRYMIQNRDKFSSQLF